MDNRRRFSKIQRLALYIAYGGKCAICGDDLASGWHSDHVRPYSKDGLTDVINGQPLCPKCNLQKGDKMFVRDQDPILPIWSFPLRTWQKRAFHDYLQSGKQNFLTVATPGAGKTTFALRVAHHLLFDDQVDMVVIVCPTDHLKKQWAQAAHGKRVDGVFYPFGLDIRPDWMSANGGIPKGCHGIVVTYQQVASKVGRDVIRWLLGSKRVFVVFDEVHHAGDDKSWGDSVRHVFEFARYRMAISGTPFRGDNNTIPYVEYDGDKSRADFNYGYSDALVDGVCRPVIFPAYEGEMEWLSRSGEVVTAIFEEVLNEQMASERLNTALSPSGNWLPSVITEAHQRLMYLRANGDPTAGGLIITKDTEHAEAVARKLFEITKQEPVIATSKDPDASTRIEKYADSNGAWIVAVRMISEGVDIPRLRVLVYATNITTELTFRQAVGRIIRVRPNLEEQVAYFYMPSDQRFLSFAQAIKEERDHVINSDDIPAPSSEPKAEADLAPRQESLFMPIASEAERGNTVVDDELISPFELAEAQRLAEQMGAVMMNLPAEVIARIMKLSRQRQQPAQQPFGEDVEAPYRRIQQLKSSIQTLVGRYSAMSGTPYEQIYTMWFKHYRGSKQSEASEEELTAKKAWLIGLITDWKRNGRK